jgi:hypothetical protein
MNMDTYSPIDQAAVRLKTTPEALRSFQQLGWISIAEKGARQFLTDHQEYKARFILHLQRVRQCDQAQIAKVLNLQSPPYRIADIDSVLANA